MSRDFATGFSLASLWIPIGAALFVVALTVSAVVVPQLRLLHLLQAVIYVAVVILARRNNVWGFGAGVTISLVWNKFKLTYSRHVGQLAKTALPANEGWAQRAPFGKRQCPTGKAGKAARSILFASGKIPWQMMPHNRHCSPRCVLAKPIDLCSQGLITEERLRNLLAAVYDRFLVDIHHHRAIADHEDEDLVQALGNCYFGDGKTDPEGRRPAGYLTRIERCIRLAYACRVRLAAMRSNGPISLTDLELLDALADTVNGASTFDWRVDRDCRIRFD